MSRIFIQRIVTVAAVVALLLAGIIWFSPGGWRNDKERWYSFRIGEIGASRNLASSLQMATVRAPGDPDVLSFLPGSLAYLPKKAPAPLFGHVAPSESAPVAAVLEPEQCLFVRKLVLTIGAPEGTGTARTVATVDQSNRGSAIGAKLPNFPASCQTNSTSGCAISVWAEARPKKC